MAAMNKYTRQDLAGLRKPELVQLIERQRQFWTDFDTKTTMNLIRSRLLAKDSPFTKEEVDHSKTFQELSAGALTRFSSSSPLTEIDDEDQSVHATPEQCEVKLFLTDTRITPAQNRIERLLVHTIKDAESDPIKQFVESLELVRALQESASIIHGLPLQSLSLIYIPYEILGDACLTVPSSDTPSIFYACNNIL
ncbi:hypothetical protein BDP27DRAFT_1435168 [Rhodocollybia butyracea]|uniref:Uncharacterized protein n=1 Tax=Rhodocollybia butyracea TaxID=206335 RepID=A0A9P5TWI4_9AGAR|nr:hypothetical protein BDP27DRAFT_1435168 [Rhodocollybia butyracea]